MKKAIIICVCITILIAALISVKNIFRPIDINIDTSGVKLTLNSNSSVSKYEISNIKIIGKLYRSINTETYNQLDTWFVGDIVVDSYSTYNNCTILFNDIGLGHFMSDDKKNSIEINNTIAIYAKDMLTNGYLVQTTGDIEGFGDLLFVWPSTSISEALKIKEICDDVNLSIW